MNLFKLFFITLFIIAENFSIAQNVGVNATGAAPDASAILDVSSTNKGILVPRVSLTSTADITTIASPQTNLTVFNTNAAMTNGNGTGFYYYNGTKWLYMVAPSNGPGTTGQVITSQGGGQAPMWAAASSTGGVNFVPNTSAFNGNPQPNNTPHPLDLSSIVGAAERVVMLKVYNPTSGSQTVRFKKFGETLSVTNTSGGVNTITMNPSTMGYVIVKTDALGRVLWETSASSLFGTALQISVVAYW